MLSDRTRGLLGAADLAKMKKTAILVNSSRGPIVDEAALIAALKEGTIAHAGLDVYDKEPVPKDYPLTKLENVTLIPHLGYVVEDSYRHFYAGTIEDIEAWLDGKPINVINPDALKKSGVRHVEFRAGPTVDEVTGWHCANRHQRRRSTWLNICCCCTKAPATWPTCRAKR